MTDPDITIHIKLSPGEDIDSSAFWLYTILEECQEIEDVEVVHG